MALKKVYAYKCILIIIIMNNKFYSLQKYYIKLSMYDIDKYFYNCIIIIILITFNHKIKLFDL